MKTFYLFFFSLILAFSACKQSTINPGGGNTQPDYFPLQVGNEWIYEKTVQDTYLLKIKIYDKKIFNNKEYYAVDYSNNVFNEEPDFEFLRSENGKILIFNGSTEEIKYDFTGTDTAYKRWHKVSYNNEVNIPLGKFSNCIVISPQDGIKGGMIYKFAPNIGLIEQGTISPNYLVLKHATINGKVLF